MSSRSRSAATGQCVMHWPQAEQSASSIFRPFATPTVVRLPVFITSQTLRLWILSQIWMQRMHLMHLLLSRMSGNSSFQGARSIFPS